jgi:hypothetical protein
MWGVGTCDLYINFSRTHSYANTRESGSNPLCEFQTAIKKFSVVFGNENLFVNTTTKGTFLGISAYLKFQHIPSCDFFALSIDTEKLIKTAGLILVNLTRVPIQIQKCCRTFQLSPVYNRVCWGFVWCGCGLLVLKNVPRGPRDFPGHFSGSREGGRLVFAWFWGPGARGGSFGVTKPKRDILVAI